MSLTFHELRPFGFEVDLDLSNPISDETRLQLQALYDRGHLLVFRHQSLTMTQQDQISGWFGPVLTDESSYISTDESLGSLGRAELAFHSDLACTPDPYLGLSLLAVDVVDGETSTLFADAVGAAAALPPALRERVELLNAVHLWPMSLSERQRSSDAPANWPGSVHPVIMRHPRTGAALLYVSRHQTDRIESLAAEESEALIQELYGYLYDPSNIYEHRWYAGDFLIWDNLALQHARSSLVSTGTRTLQRSAMATKSYKELQPPELVAVYKIPVDS